MTSDEMGYYLLKELGFEVESIPRSNIKKEADFLVNYGDSSALVEVKLKQDDPELASEKEKTLEAGKVFVAEAKLGRDETLSGIVKNASKQLKSSSDRDHGFRVLLFIATGINSKTKADQFKDTIYGSTQIFENVDKPLKTCYFFRNSDFYRRQLIDAAIVANVIEDRAFIRLCLNSYSQNYTSLKSSNFLIPFCDSIDDPLEEEKAGKAYILDGNVNRKKSDFEEMCSSYDPALIYLAEKYNTGPLIKVDFDSPEISVRY